MNKNSRTGATAATVLAMTIAGFSAPALAEDGIQLSGQVNRAVMFADDGSQSKGFFVDNSNSGSRFRMKGKREVSPGLKAGFLIELQYQSNPSDAVNFATPSVSADLGERHIDAYLEGGFGKVSLGQGNGAANGGMESDLSGTTVVTYSGMTDFGGGISFGNGGPAIGDTMGNLDFESRYDRLRYDLPGLGPVGLAVSLGTKSGNDVYELAARPELKLGSGKLASAIGYSVEKKGGARGDEQTTGFSVSYLMGSGLNGTLAYATRGDDTPGGSDKKITYFKLGYKTGAHAMSFDYGIGNDFDAVGDDSTAFGVAYVYKAAKWLELYAGGKIHSLDRTGLNTDDVTIIAAGTRIKF